MKRLLTAERSQEKMEKYLLGNSQHQKYIIPIELILHGQGYIPGMRGRG